MLSIVKMSTKWGLSDGHDRAIYHLEQDNAKFSHLLKFHTGIKYNIPKWVLPAFDLLVSTDWTLGQATILSDYTATNFGGPDLICD